MQKMAFGQVYRADSPVLVATPHTGTAIPDDLLQHPAWVPIAGRLADPAGVAMQAAAVRHGASFVSALYHPCVIDFNIATDNRPLSQRLNRIGLCRTHTSRGESLYGADGQPSEAEVEMRVDRYWRPFHAAVTSELVRLRQMHENVLLLVTQASSWLSPYRNQAGASECNVGTNQGASCDRQLVSTLTGIVKSCGHSWVVNGKVADVFCAQRYGMPENGIHAIEVEIAGRWRTDLEFDARDTVDPKPDAAMEVLLEALMKTLRRLPRAEAVSAAAFEDANGHA